MRTNDTIEEAWYRNPWVWLIIAIPGLTVIGCVITIFLAVSAPDIVVDDSEAQRPGVTQATEANKAG